MPQFTPLHHPAQPLPRRQLTERDQHDRILANDTRDMLRASRCGDEETLAVVRHLRFQLAQLRVPLDGPARWALIALAHRGYDVDVYYPVCASAPTIWLRPPEPWMEGRWSLDDWRIGWRVAYRNRVFRVMSQEADA